MSYKLCLLQIFVLSPPSKKIKSKVRLKKACGTDVFGSIVLFFVFYCVVRYGLVIQKTFISDLQAVVSIATYPTFYYELVHAAHSVPLLKLQ